MPGGTAFYCSHAIRHFNDIDYALITAVGATEIKVVEELRETGINVSVVCCSDERVNILRVVSFACLLLCCGTAEERACQYKCAKDRIGFLHRFAINKYFA